ncbi:MAG: hypothetical protein LUC23_05240 [Prevotellaceae bacterium]|nr:hypothetical protein [Prevotellaceae bacterium]
MKMPRYPFSAKAAVLVACVVCAACKIVYGGLRIVPTRNGELRLEKPPLIPASYAMECMVTWWDEIFKNSPPLLHLTATAPAVAADGITKTSPSTSSLTADKWCFRADTLLMSLAVAVLPVGAWLFLLCPFRLPGGITAPTAATTTSIYYTTLLKETDNDIQDE